jgi:hypothetical protein
MLKIQNRHVLWDTHQIVIPAEHAKDAESRRIPCEPKGRLSLRTAMAEKLWRKK